MACEKDYSKGVIYTIKTDDGLYVGSTYDFKHRKICHKCNIYNENCVEYNFKVYQNIRANDGEYRIELYKPFPCENDIELRQEEERIRIELDANLNMKRAYRTEEGKKEYDRKHYENNRVRILERQREIITCECGLEIQRGSIPRHRKTEKHLNRMEELNEKI